MLLLRERSEAFGRFGRQRNIKKHQECFRMLSNASKKHQETSRMHERNHRIIHQRFIEPHTFRHYSDCEPSYNRTPKNSLDAFLN